MADPKVSISVPAELNTSDITQMTHHSLTMSVRAASDDDIGAITSIYADAVTHTTATYELTPPSQAEMQQRISAIRDAGFPCLVAEDQDQRVVGYAYVSPFRPRPAYRFTVEHSVYVLAGERGRGVGRRLTGALIKECERLGFRQMVAVIGDGQENQASVTFHERLGFWHAGRLEGSGYKFGRWLDTVLMQLSLGGGTGGPPDPQAMLEERFQRGEME